MILKSFSNYVAFISSITLPNKEFWLLFSTLTLISLPMWLSLPSKITEFKNLLRPKYLFWFLSLFSTSTSKVLPSKDLFNSIWLLNNFSWMVISLFLTETIGVMAGGIIVPGYFALYLQNPIHTTITFFIGCLTYLIIYMLSKFMLIYGRRRLILWLLLELKV